MKETDYNDIIMQPELIGANLRALRTSKDYTLDELARRSQLSKPFLSLVESGKRAIRPLDLRRILAEYDYSLGYFLSRIELSVNDKADPDATIVPDACTLLLDGKRKEGAYSLILLRVMKNSSDTQLLRLHLPAQTQMSDSYLCIDAKVRGVVAQGTLLLDMRGDEHRIREGEEFRYDGKKEHLLRNYTNQSLTAYLWIEGGKF